MSQIRRVVFGALLFVAGCISSAAFTAYAKDGGGQVWVNDQATTVRTPKITTHVVAIANGTGFGQMTTYLMKAGDGEIQCLALYESLQVGASMVKLDSTFCQ